MNHLVKRAFIRVNSRWYTSSAARTSGLVRPPFDEAVIEGRGRGIGMLLGGCRRMMSTATKPSQKTEVAEKKNENSDSVAEEEEKKDLGYSSPVARMGWCNCHLVNRFKLWMRKNRKLFESSEEKMRTFEVFKNNFMYSEEEKNEFISGCKLGRDATAEDFCPESKHGFVRFSVTERPPDYSVESECDEQNNAPPVVCSEQEKALLSVCDECEDMPDAVERERFINECLHLQHKFLSNCNYY